MKKYLFIIPSPANGGAERVVSVIANELANRNKDVAIMIYYHSKNEYKLDEKVKIFNISNGNEEDYNKIGKLKRMKLFRKVLHDYNPTYIIPFVQHVNIQTFIYCAFTRFSKRIIYTVRNSPYVKSGLKGKIHDYLINNKNISIVQNQYQKDYYKESSKKHIFVLPNPVNGIFLDEKTNAPRNPFLIVSSGRLTKQKNFPLLINSFSEFAKDKDDAFLHIYGEGEDKEALNSLIKNKNMQDKIKLMGRSNDLVGVYKNASTFVLSSDFEGMPNALLEAMAIGLPCISTDCPTGPNEMIVNGENGWLVPVGETEKMANAIQFVYENEQIAKETGEKAREFASCNSVGAIVDKFEKIVDYNN